MKPALFAFPNNSNEPWRLIKLLKTIPSVVSAQVTCPVVMGVRVRSRYG